MVAAQWNTTNTHSVTPQQDHRRGETDDHALIWLHVFAKRDCAANQSHPHQVICLGDPPSGVYRERLAILKAEGASRPRARARSTALLRLCAPSLP